MKIGDVVTLSHYPRMSARVIDTWEFPDASRAQMCRLHRTLRGNRKVTAIWRACDLKLIPTASQTEGNQ